MTPLVEKVAKAIFRASFCPSEDEATVESKWEEWAQSDQPRYFRYAQAAITAIESSHISAAKPEDRELVARLRRRHTCTGAGETTVHHLINPDGPEAADRIESLSHIREALEGAREEIDRLRDEVVGLWHQAPNEDRSLSECLGMSDEEYAAFVNPKPSEAGQV